MEKAEIAGPKADYFQRRVLTALLIGEAVCDRSSFFFVSRPEQLHVWCDVFGALEIPPTIRR